MKPELDARARAALSRRLSRIVGDETGLEAFDPAPPPAFRLGVTGSPGAGKSTLIGILAARRAEAGAPLAVLAVDPTSPFSRGSVLGDRIRMDAAAGHPDIFIRSLPSRSSHDGLCANTEPLLRLLERSGFNEIVLETVGVGQAQHTIGAVTDTVVMVLTPHAGDSIQAMKAGLMEMADIYVVNKADLPDARRSAADIKAIVQRGRKGDAWQPPVIMTCSTSGDGVEELSQAVDHHRSAVVAARPADTVAAQRARHHAGEILQRRLAALLADPGRDWSRALTRTIAEIAAELGSRIS